MVDRQLSTAQRYGELLTNAAPTDAVLDAARLAAAQLPEPGNERWKYSPVNRLYEAFADIAETAPPLVNSTESAELLGEVDVSRYPLAAATVLGLNSAIKHTLADSQTLRVAHPGPGHHWLHIDVPANCAATVIQSDAPVAGASVVTTVNLASGATLAHSLNGTAGQGHHWHLLSVTAGENSTYNLHQLSLGGALERVDTHIRMTGRGAQAHLRGALLCGNNDRLDTQVVLEHQAPGCSSTARYHGLANHTGKLTFGGRIHILADGAGTDARLHNPNLLLSEQAEINTKPELEIYNDDVACAHGATVGQLNDDAVFYLRSRGIPATAARTLMLRGFVGDVLGGADIERATALATGRFEEWML